MTGFFSSLVTQARISWIKYWALQRRFALDHTTLSFRRALGYFIVFLFVIYFFIGLPVLGYLIYVRHSDGIPLAIASTLYPFPVATVGGDVILLKPYSDRLTLLKFFAQQTKQPLPSDAELRTQVINKLVDEAVVRQWSNKEGIVVTNEDIDNAYQKIIQDRGNEGAVRTVLSQLYDLSETEFKRLIPDVLYREKVETTILQRVHVKHILVSSDTLAKRVKDETNPENFNDKSKQYSEDKTTRDNGGDLGFFDKCQAEKLAPELAAKFFELQPGQISDPVRSQYGFHVIYVIEKTGTEFKCFDQWLSEKRTETKIRKFFN